MRQDDLDATRQAAAMWGLGGSDYDDVSFAISDALAHAAQRLNAQPGQAVLDVATGTGWSARNAARRGARVTAVDISEELLAAARQLLTHCVILEGLIKAHSPSLKLSPDQQPETLPR